MDGVFQGHCHLGPHILFCHAERLFVDAVSIKVAQKSDEEGENARFFRRRRRRSIVQHLCFIELDLDREIAHGLCMPDIHMECVGEAVFFAKEDEKEGGECPRERVFEE